MTRSTRLERMGTTAYSALWSTRSMEIRTIASFYNCTANEYIANRMKKAGIKKGRMIEIIGNLALRPYATDDGNKQISADVSVLEWHFTGSKPKSDDADSSQSDPKPAPKGTGKVHQEQTIPTGDDDDDDLPI